MLGFHGKIEVEAVDVSRIFPPLTKSNFNRGEIRMASQTITNFCIADGCSNGVRGTSRWCFQHLAQISEEDRFWFQVAITADDSRCWEWQGGLTNGTKGYGLSTFKKQIWRTHRLAWLLVKGRPPQMDLLHSCDNPPCCNPNHLREGTPAENTQDALDRGRFILGEDRSISQLTYAQVREIKVLLVARLSQREIATRFGVSQRIISAIRLGITYKNAGGIEISTIRLKRTPEEQKERHRQMVRDRYLECGREDRAKYKAKHPPGPGPFKHATEEDRQAARKAARKRYKERIKLKKLLSQ